MLVAAGYFRRGGCSESLCYSRWAGFAVQPNGVTGFAIRIIMYWNETAWMAIKNKPFRYIIEDGKMQHTIQIFLYGQRTRRGDGVWLLQCQVHGS